MYKRHEDLANYPLKVAGKKLIRDFLWDKFEFTKKEYEVSYPSCANGYRSWMRTFGSGHTDTMRAIMWYQHRHKKGSREWRPKIIMDALCDEVSKSTRGESESAGTAP